MKRILYNKESRKKLRKGVNQVANAVKVTLGPSGKNVVLAQDPMNPIVTKDGVSVARTIYLEDPFENAGAQMMKQAAEKTNEMVGDGTTTATVLAQAILDEGYKRLDKGGDLISILNDLRDNLPKVLGELDKMSKPVTTESEIGNIALISTNNDRKLAKILQECYSSVKDNIIFENSPTNNTYHEIVNGMRIKMSYLSSSFIPDETSELEYKDSLLFLFNGKVENIKQISRVLYAAERRKLPLVIVCENMDIGSINNIIGNRDILECTVLASPGFGFGRQKTLRDIAVFTGAGIYDAKSDLDNIVFGVMDAVKIDDVHTIVMSENADRKKIVKRIKELERSKVDKNPYEVARIDDRISKFKNGIGIVFIGANSPLELKERKDRLEDSINAIKAATEQGIITGGGITFMEIGLKMKDSIYTEVLKSPYRQICENKGKNIMRIEGKDIITYDTALLGLYMEQGIIDPVKVTKTALENAVSVASVILTTECTII